MLIFLYFLQFQLPNEVLTADPTCPDGFTFWNDATCVKLFEEPLLYQDALHFCETFTGGNLVSIHNAIDNRALVNIAVSQGFSQPLWLGLTCSDYKAQYTLCTWEDESGYSTSFKNFANNGPSTNVGSNAYLMTSGSSVGNWVSADGTVQKFGYFCEVPANNQKMFCPNEFNDYCYTLNLNPPFVDAAGARAYCQKECGDLVSIHSHEENMHVYSLYPYLSVWEQVRIGANTNESGNYWLDGSSFDYSNFGYCNSDIGSCSSFSIYRDSVAQYKWMSNPCDQKIPFVCKRAKTVQSCGPVSPSIPKVGTATGMCGPTPTVVPDYPLMCSHSQYFTGTGTIYSPFYPDNYNNVSSGPCIYIIVAPRGSIAQVKFTPETYINHSTIDFFSQLEDGESFANFTGHPPAYSFNSSTNVIKMVFHEFWEVHVPEEKWVAKFGYDDSFE